MPFMLEQPYRPIAPAFVSFGPGFSENQARNLIHLHGQSLESVSSCAEGHAASYQKAQVRWCRENAWIFRTFQDFALRAQKHAYPFTYAGFMEPLELHRFTESTQSYSDWLMPLAAGNKSARKLTIVCELSEPGEYEGGELEVWGATGKREVSDRKLGSFHCFPSYCMHRVKPVTYGTRWAVVGHLYGPPFA